MEIKSDVYELCHLLMQDQELFLHHLKAILCDRQLLLQLYLLGLHAKAILAGLSWWIFGCGMVMDHDELLLRLGLGCLLLESIHRRLLVGQNMLLVNSNWSNKMILLIHYCLLIRW